MRTPNWFRLRRVDHAAGVVTATFDVDVSRYIAGLTSANAGMARLRAQMDALSTHLQHAQEVQDAGLWARWYVKGALDPAYASEAARDDAVRFLAGGGYRFAPVALDAFLQGWATHRPQVCRARCQHAEAIGAPEWASCADGIDRCSWFSPEPLAWHRRVGSTDVVVTTAVSA